MKKLFVKSAGCMAVVAMSLASASCSQQKAAEQVDPILSHIDSTVRPQDDFFEYANGAWLNSHPIDPSENSVGIFKAVDDTVQAQVYKICLEASAAQFEKGSNKQKIGDLYYSGMDSTTLNAAGISALKEYLDRIDAMTSVDDLAQTAAYISSVSGTPFFGFGVSQDEMNSDVNVVSLSQGGLSMPDRNYYVDDDANTQNVRQAFQTYAKGIFGKMGYDDNRAQTAVDNILGFETSLAKNSRKREDLRDPFANYNKMTVSRLSDIAAGFDWKAFMAGVGLNNVDSVVVGQPEFFTSLGMLLRHTDLNVLKDYMKFQVVDGMAAYMDDETYMLNFNFYSKTLRGAEVPRPRWKRVVDVTNSVLGDLVGQVYVAEYLPKGTKEKFIEIGDAIRAEFANHIKNLDWMSEPTKEKALQKLDAVNMKLAYPDTWKDMSALDISRDSYTANIINANRWRFDRMVKRYGQPVDRSEWHMQPQTYNAYYSPTNNEICIPGCNIIVPGFEGRMPDDAILYAIIGGSTFGHEITHGFDDSGCKYDAKGNLSDWWTAEDKAKFEEKTKKIVEQFDGYEVINGLHINGENTQGENIADLGGLIMGYEAFKKTEQYKNNVIIGGFTPDQRYFLGHAQAWMVKYRDEALITRVKTDEHSPAKWRVIGPLSDCEEFYEAWGVKEGDKMWRAPEDRVKIW